MRALQDLVLFWGGRGLCPVTYSTDESHLLKGFWRKNEAGGNRGADWRGGAWQYNEALHQLYL